MAYIKLTVDTSDDSMFGQEGVPNCDYNKQEWLDALKAEIESMFGVNAEINESDYLTRLDDTDLDNDPWPVIEHLINTTWQDWLDTLEDC